MLNVTKKNDKGTMTVTLDGRLDNTTSMQLESELNDSFDGVSAVVFDCHDLQYVSSAGLRVFLSLQKKLRGQSEIRITRVSEDVMDIFEVTGFVDILNIEREG